MNQIFSFLLVFIFAIFLPFQEWPDVNAHWDRGNYYVQLIKSIQELLGLLEPSFVYSNEHEHFFSGLWTQEKFRVYKLNLIKIPFVFVILFLINKVSIRCTGAALIFSPPFIFSLMTISNEPFAIFLIVISYLLVYQGKILLPITIGFIATIIDRSMIVNYSSIFLMLLYFRLPIKFFIWFSILFFSILSFLIIRQETIKYLLDNFYFYGIYWQDIIFNTYYGDRSFLALLATLSGLFGWISVRPEPWFIYYSLVIFLFIIGLFICDTHLKIEFLIFLFPVIAILFIISSLSQARYFPVLTLIFWQIVWVGFSSFFRSRFIFCSSFTLMIFYGLFLSHL